MAISSTIAAVFIAGIGAGIAIHRLIMVIVLEKSPDDLCTYCEWLERKKSRQKQ